MTSSSRRIPASSPVALYRTFAKRDESGASRDHSCPNRVQDDLGGIVKIQLLHQIPAMRFNRRHTNIEECRYFLVGAPLGKEMEHLLFAIGQEVIRVGQPALLQRANVV